MGQVKKPDRAILFAGILYTPSIELDSLFMILEDEFGSIVLKSQSICFSETDYYESEMGKDITRIWIGFDNLIAQDDIADVKLRCNDLELTLFSSSGKRNVNIDPGYLTKGKVVLATTKNNQHRLYLKKGIYAEVTLRFKNKTYMPWEWTYRDYRRKEAIDFFYQLRSIYRSKLSA